MDQGRLRSALGLCSLRAWLALLCRSFLRRRSGCLASPRLRLAALEILAEGFGKAASPLFIGFGHAENYAFRCTWRNPP